ncbi:hypothetical protein JW826_04925 [Candidatus Woesearchaeota archaeon]|nr:hypothetical protein [Candidatus Woesearchaeota archaeon]
MKGKPSLIFVLLLVVCASLAAQPGSAKTYQMTLLTVGEAGDDLFGGTAKAYLEVKPGSGRIFLDSFPLTKLDTQISTRYANKIACDYRDLDCTRYDFFYTIRADSTIVGGPSASAPLTILTIAALEKLDLKNDTVMTGTINSGGSIGPVGGIKQKAKAAQDAGFERILIPKFSISGKGGNESNASTNPIIRSIQITTTNNNTQNRSENKSITVVINDILVNNTERPEANHTPEENEADDRSDEKASDYDLTNLTIEIVEVRSLEEALPYFTDKMKAREALEIRVPDAYIKMMKEISESLCNKAYRLKMKVNLSESDRNKTVDFESKINASLESGDHYSAASFCFNMGVLLRKANINEVSLKRPDRLELIRAKTLQTVEALDNNLENRTISTLPEMESYIIVKERVIEAKQILKEIKGNITADELAYAIERYYSAAYWSVFFKLKGEPIKLDQDFLEEACYKKTSEAEERLNYADLYLPSILRATREDIDEAQKYAKEGNYKMCLFKASFAKAEANLLLSSLSIEKEQLGDLASEKLSSAERLIAKESARGYFPIMGYSYFEYASSLNANNESVSSLIFSEYSLELSNLEMYFPKHGFRLPNVNYEVLTLLGFTFLAGMAAGSLLTINLILRRMKERSKGQAEARSGVRRGSGKRRMR